LFLTKGKSLWEKPLNYFWKQVHYKKRIKIVFSKGEFPLGKTRKLSYVRMLPVNTDLFLCLYMSNL
jgi:hypothetical protein